MKHSFSVLEDVELSRGFFLKNDIYKAISDKGTEFALVALFIAIFVSSVKKEMVKNG